jgi:hypothetical protein
VSRQTVNPKDFFSDAAPERIIGVECEYNLQEGYGFLAPNSYITPEIVQRTGVRKYGQFLDNGGKLYQDYGEQLEYATAECLGPKEAAEADMAGIELVRRIVKASGLPCNGIYRTTGASVRKAGSIMQRDKTSGYHENYMLPRSASGRKILDNIIPAHLASRIWGMSGTLREDYVFSQKVWGIGGQPVTRVVERQTAHGQKPMAMIPPNDDDTIGNKRWARLEVRYADAGLSPLVRYVGFAATSLVLRLVEYEHLLSPKLADVSFKSPVSAAKMFARDLTLQKRSELNDGRRVTALDTQEMLLDFILDLTTKVELPQSELEAIPHWIEIRDKLKSSQPKRGEYNGLETKLDIAAKHVVLLRRHQNEKLSNANPAAMQTSLLWDRILEKGAGQKWWEHYGADVLDAEKIEYLVTKPPATRAHMRSNEMKKKFKRLNGVGWTRVIRGTETIPLDDAYRVE